MSFTVKLCKNLSDKICARKSVSIVQELTGSLRDSTSIIDPTIIIECSSDVISNVNYLEIDEFGRKYFVNDIKSVRKNIWELTCHVDVLSSFIDDIVKNKAIIRRQQSKWNLYLNDDSFKCYQNPYIVQKQFSGGFNTAAYGLVLLVAGQPSSQDETDTQES